MPDTTLPTFTGASIVQLVSGDPHRPGAEVVTLAGGDVEIDVDRIVARTASAEWTWLLRDLDAVIDSPDDRWTLLPVPGVPDHGVAVAVADVDRFRTALRRATSGAAGDLRVSRPAPPDPPAVAIGDEERMAPAFEPLTAVLDAWTRQDPTTEVHVPAAPTPSPPASAPVPSPPATSGDLAALEAREISAWFGSHHVLDRVSLTMHAGEVTALIGPSGCGKSTFLRILNRMHEMIPSASLAGEVRLDGQDIYDPSRKLTAARRQIGMVFQKPNPFPAMSIYDNVVASFRLTGTKLSSAEKDDVVETCLTKAGLWSEVRDRLRSPGGSLSGGQQQRLCIARALAIQPRVLLMDEPCSALDPTSTRRIEETIIELRSEVTIVIVTHNMQQAARVSNRCAFFLAEAGTPGMIVEHGDTEAMFGSPQDERTYAYVNGRFG